MTTATIHLGTLRANFERIRALAAPAQVMAVVKADAYGHGLERVARTLGGVAEAFAVATLDEAQRLREAGHRQRVLVLSGPQQREDVDAMRRLGIEAVIHHDSQLHWLSDAGAEAQRLKAWLMVDSGMHRLGFAPSTVRQVHARLAELPAVDPEIGLMAHFSDSEVANGEHTPKQIACFEAATRGLPGPRSLSNSGAVLLWPQARADWVRPGGLLYGLSLVQGRSGADFGLQPAMTLSTHLIAVRSFESGEAIGYNGTFVCPERMRVGVAAIGYGDGYPRNAPSGTPVLVGATRAALAGRVSMDLITLDLRRAPEAAVGDPVTLWGRGLPSEEVAVHAGTLAYDLTCGITRRVRFVDDPG